MDPTFGLPDRQVVGERARGPREALDPTRGLERAEREGWTAVRFLTWYVGLDVGDGEESFGPGHRTGLPIPVATELVAENVVTLEER